MHKTHLLPIYIFIIFIVLLTGCSSSIEQLRINQAREAIKIVPLPTIYSEVDGSKLLTKELVIDIAYYDPSNGAPYFKANCDYYNPNTHYWNTSWYDNGHTARLACMAVDDHNRSYTSHNFTLSYLRDYPDKFHWEY
jgi:uncharacterized membrane protein